MDRNLFLAVLLSMGVFTLWASWQASNAPPPAELVEQARVEQAAAEASAGDELAQGTPGTAVPQGSSAPPVADVPAAAPAGPRPAAAPSWTRTFDTGKYHATLSNRGAGLRSWVLSDYTEPGRDAESHVELLGLRETNTVALRTPFAELGLGDLGDAAYTVESEWDAGAEFTLQSGGVTIRKRFAFEPDGYDFSLSIELQNQSGRVLQPRFAMQWPVFVRDSSDFKEQSLALLYDGSVEREMVVGVGAGGFLGGLFGGGSGAPTEVTSYGPGEVEWFGVDNRYFVSAVAPSRKRGAQVRFEPIEPNKSAANVWSLEPVDLPSGQALKQEFRGYIGPKTDTLLESFGAGLTASVNRGYAIIEPLVHFFTWLLRAIYSVIPNYGVAIILLTLLVRVATLPIIAKQMRSMEKMRALQPRMKELQEKFADDKQKQSEAMMKLYRETGVNPLGGCLPMLLQLPVFIGLFYALQSSIELRQAPFVLWMTDLSAPDALFTIPGLEIPFRVLPILMAASMVVQAKVQPMSVDPSQAAMMTTIMPIMMLVLFYQFPSGLVLYYMLSNFLGIGHQLWVGKNMKKEGGAASPAKE